jgi:hypothetical protein
VLTSGVGFVIIDDLAVHRSPMAEGILHDKGAWFLFLRPAPDLNPIEMALPSSMPTCAASAPEPSTPSGVPSARAATSSRQANAGTTSAR